MVKSRRRASSAQSWVKVTRAWRPKVSMSRRSVVTSNGKWSTTMVTVPCSMPVGCAVKPAARASRMVSSGSAVVAMSMSLTAVPISALRTEPPTTRA